MMRTFDDLRPERPPTLKQQPNRRLEAAFLGEMLKIAMPDSSAGAFGGGVGESQFASFLTDCYADALSARLNLGLDDRIGRRDE